MAADMAIELKKKGVVSVSLWPGAVQTELINQYTSHDEASPGFDPKVSLFICPSPKSFCFLSSLKKKNIFLNIYNLSFSVKGNI